MNRQQGSARCSIVLPVCNRASLTRQCLNVLLDGPAAGFGVEIIVVDDGSSDLTQRVLAEYGDRIRVVVHRTNTGFGAACNDGAAIAVGAHLVFLNNDTIPGPHWLEELERYVEQQPRAAIVGSKLLYLNDTVQHAGVTICQDAYPRHIYAGFAADHPAVNKSRRFQAVTGACMLVRREAFERLHGFDSAYHNGYEDVDFCLRAGEIGLEVHYCHRSWLHHLESASRNLHPADLAHNDALFRSRWAHRVTPDDLQFYIEDGLLQVSYSDAYPVRLSISPALATIDGDQRDRQADQLLQARSRQVFELLKENARLNALGVAAAPIDTAPVMVAAPTYAGLIPSQELQHSVGEFFFEGGHEYLQYFIELGGLKTNDSVLDVGCGVGRMAVPLTGYLDSNGRYEGFDIVEEGIDWCRQKISAKYPNFRFQLSDVFNRFYNATSTQAPATYSFPFGDRQFDFVFLTSVFTHMLPLDVEHYISEIARVLKVGGRVMATFFLLNPESEDAIDRRHTSSFLFTHAAENYRALDRDVPESAIAYREDSIRRVFEGNNLQVLEPIRYGTWPGRPRGLSLQDIVVAVKDVARTR